MDTKDIIEMASNAAVGLSAVVVAALGALGFNAWRRRAKSEAAQKLIGLAKKAQTEIQATRTMVTSAGEAFERRREPDESEGTRLIRDERFARMKRLDQPRASILRLYERGWEVEALLGIELGPYLDPIAEQLVGIQQAIQSLFMIDSLGHVVKREDNKDTADDYTRVYGANADDDTITPALDEAVNRLRERLKRYV